MSISCRPWKLDCERDSFGKKKHFLIRRLRKESDSESIFLPLSRIWIESFTKHQVSKQKSFLEFKIRWKFHFQKLTFVGKFTPKKRRKWPHCVFWKAKTWGKMLVKETTFDSSFWEALNFESIVLKRVRFWYKFFEGVTFWANLWKVVIFGIENLRKCQIIKLCGNFSVKKPFYG